MQSAKVSAYAHTNIALIKYWGKANPSNNLPAVGSLSLTLDAFGTKTCVELYDAAQDTFTLNEVKQTGTSLKRVTQFLDLVRKLSKSDVKCNVTSQNNVATASGLASSASGFAALALASTHAFGLDVSQENVSDLARQGSGSAARSIFGGFSYIRAPQQGDTFCAAHPLSAHPSLDVCMLVISCTEQAKSLSSRDAMALTQASSPYYKPWVDTHLQDLNAAIKTVQSGDFTRLGELTEHSTLKMHATLLGAALGHWYFLPLTIELMQAVRKMRKEGIEAYFTMDAGPHVKVLCQTQDTKRVYEKLAHYVEPSLITHAQVGPAAYLLAEPVA